MDMPQDVIPQRTPASSRSIVGGAGVLLGGRFLGAILSWIGTALIARTLDGDHFGSFSFVFNLLGLLGLIADFETTRIVLTEVGRSTEAEIRELTGKFMVFRIVLGLVAYAIALAAVAVGPYSSLEVQAVAIGGASLVIASALWSLISICQAKRWLRLVAGALLAGQVGQFAMIIALKQSGEGSMLRYIVPYVASDAIALVIVALGVRTSLPIRLSVDVQRWRRWITEAAPLALGSALGTLYFRIDSVMLTLLLPREARFYAVGTYQVGYKFSDLLAFVAPALIAATLPTLARAWPRDPVTFHATFRQAVVLTAVVAAFAVVMFSIFAEPVIVAAFDAKFSGAEASARWLVIAQALNFVSQLAYVCLVSADRRTLYPVVTMCGLAINVGLNFVLIPRHSVMGAATATIVTEVVVLLLLVANIVDMPLRPLPVRAFVVTAASAAGAGLSGWLVWRASVWPLGIAVGTAVYIGALHIFNVDGPGGLPTLVRRSRFDRITEVV